MEGNRSRAWNNVSAEVALKEAQERLGADGWPKVQYALTATARYSEICKYLLSIFL